MIRLLVGLGNPGPQYEHTRHNAGFWWIDEAAVRLKVPLAPEAGFFGTAGRTGRSIAGAPGVDGPVWLLQPMTFMNLSGRSVASLARFYKIAPAEVLVVHDELDLLPGQAKLKLGGSSAGHNGLKDITAQLGSPDYWRLRLGIGHPGVKAEVANWVLKKPSADDRAAIDAAIAQSLSALPRMLQGDMAGALAAIHAKPPRPKPPRPEGLPTHPGPAAATDPSRTPQAAESPREVRKPD